MLKITQMAEDDMSMTLKLEGQIVGRWANELEKECKKYMRKRSKLSLDLFGVTNVDDQGIKMLRAMVGNQVKLIRCSLLLSGILEKGDRPTLEEPEV